MTHRDRGRCGWICALMPGWYDPCTTVAIESAKGFARDLADSNIWMRRWMHMAKIHESTLKSITQDHVYRY